MCTILPGFLSRSFSPPAFHVDTPDGIGYVARQVFPLSLVPSVVSGSRDMNWGLAIFGVAAIWLVGNCLQGVREREVAWSYAGGVK